MFTNITEGITCYDGSKSEYFTLRAHILAWTGDIPAISKIMCLTGHNSYSGCRFCNLQETLSSTNNHVYYPLPNIPNNNNLIQLPPIRTHNEMLNKTNQLEHLKGNQRENLIRECG